MAPPVPPNTNINDLSGVIFFQIMEILDINSTWKRLINILPENYFNATDILGFEKPINMQVEPARAFLYELGNRGMTVKQLIPYLESLQLERALLPIKEFEPVKLLEELPSYMEVPLGFNSHFTLECKATGFPRPSFQWLKVSASEKWEKLKEQTGHVLNIKPVRHQDDGLYICCVHNRNHHDKQSPSVEYTNEFRLKVTFTKCVQEAKPKPVPPPLIFTHPRLSSRGPVELGSDLTFKCEAKGVKPILFEWFKNGYIINVGITDEEERSTLKIDNIQRENDNPRFTIQCQASNPGGRTMSKELKFVLAMPGPTTQIKVEAKIVLLIGNGEYSTHTHLPNVKNDVKSLAQRLKEMDFMVFTLLNLEKHEMNNAIDKFCSLLDTAAYGVFYYAGHGFQSNRRDYMVPVTSPNDYNPQECICLDDVEVRMQHKNPALCCLILDMCRNDILCPGQNVEAPKPISFNRNKIFVYATTNSCSALDGRDGQNGLFMKHLLKNINLQKPVKEMFDKVVADIGMDSSACNTQVPEISSTLITNVSLMDYVTPKSEERECRYNDLINLPRYLCVKFGDVNINIELEPYEEVIHNVLAIRLSLSYTDWEENYSAHVTRVFTENGKEVEYGDVRCISNPQQCTQILIPNIQKIKEELTMEMVLRCNTAQSPPVCVPLGLPLVSRACLWHQESNFGDLADSGVVSGISHTTQE